MKRPRPGASVQAGQEAVRLLDQATSGAHQQRLRASAVAPDLVRSVVRHRLEDPVARARQRCRRVLVRPADAVAGLLRRLRVLLALRDRKELVEHGAQVGVLRRRLRPHVQALDLLVPSLRRAQDALGSALPTVTRAAGVARAQQREPFRAGEPVSVRAADVDAGVHQLLRRAAVVRIEQREALTDLVTGDLGDAALLRTALDPDLRATVELAAAQVGEDATRCQFIEQRASRAVQHDVVARRHARDGARVVAAHDDVGDAAGVNGVAVELSEGRQQQRLPAAQLRQRVGRRITGRGIREGGTERGHVAIERGRCVGHHAVGTATGRRASKATGARDVNRKEQAPACAGATVAGRSRARPLRSQPAPQRFGVAVERQRPRGTVAARRLLRFVFQSVGDDAHGVGVDS